MNNFSLHQVTCTEARDLSFAMAHIFLIIYCLLSLPNAAIAAPTDLQHRAAPVTDRVHPRLVPLGTKYSSYDIYPSLSLTSQYDDNVRSNNNSRRSSLLWVTSPQIFAISNWNRHQIELGLQADIGRYTDLISENYEDWEVSLKGTYELDAETRILGAGKISRDHLERSAPTDANGLEPTKQLNSSLSIEYQQTKGQFNFSLNTSLAFLNFDDVPAIQAGVPITLNQDDRDRSNYKTSLRLGYQPFLNQEYYMQVSRETRSYKNLQDTINLDRTSTGYEVTAGFQTDFNGIYFGDVYVGYKWQDYKDTFADIKTPVLGVDLHWNPTLLTSISLATKRTTNEALNPAFSGYVSTGTKLSIAHELHREVVLKFSANQVKDEYKSRGASRREDSTIEFSLGASYSLDRETYTSLEYFRGKRSSDDNTAPAGAQDEFQKNIIQLKIQKFF